MTEPDPVREKLEKTYWKYAREVEKMDDAITRLGRDLFLAKQTRDEYASHAAALLASLKALGYPVPVSKKYSNSTTVVEYDDGSYVES